MNDNFRLSELQHKIAAEDDQAAFRELFAHFHKRLVQFANAILKDREAARDVVSDIFVRIWIKRKTIDNIQNLTLYLYVATRNHCLNYLRNQRKEPFRTIDQLDLELEQKTNDPLQNLIHQELFEKLTTIVNGLPPKCRIIFKLVKEDGLKQKEVAELMQLQPKTIENQLAIAARKIGMLLNQYLGAKSTNVKK